MRLKRSGRFCLLARPSVKTVNLSLCAGSIPSSSFESSAKLTPVSMWAVLLQSFRASSSSLSQQVSVMQSFLPRYFSIAR